jgi:hypothetical protein
LAFVAGDGEGVEANPYGAINWSLSDEPRFARLPRIFQIWKTVIRFQNDDVTTPFLDLGHMSSVKLLPTDSADEPEASFCPGWPSRNLEEAMPPAPELVSVT